MCFGDAYPRSTSEPAGCPSHQSNASRMYWTLVFAVLPFHFGLFASGPLDAITDVPGVRVAHVTKVESGDIRTGATAVLPNTNPWDHKVSAAFFAFNGNGELTCSQWMEESSYM